MELIDGLKQIEDQLAGLREERGGLQKKTGRQISELEEEVRGFEGMKQTVNEEEFFSEDKSNVEKQIQHFDKEVAKRRKRIESIRASAGTEIGKLDQEIGKLDAAYVKEGRGALPPLFHDLCLKFNKRRNHERGILGALMEQIDRFFKVVEESSQARSRYVGLLAKFKSFQDVPDKGIEKMETRTKETVGISNDPKNPNESWMLSRVRDIRRELINAERDLRR